MSGNEFKISKTCQKYFTVLTVAVFLESDFQNKEKTNYTPACMQICMGM